MLQRDRRAGGRGGGKERKRERERSQRTDNTD